MKKLTWKIAGAMFVLALASAIVVASAASAESPDFSLSASPSSEWITPVQLAQYRVAVKSLNGFSGEVLLRCRPNSALIKCSVMPSEVHVGPGESPTPEVLMLASAGAGTAFGTYSIQIVGNTLPVATDAAGRNIATVTLRVIPIVTPPDN
jgi:hypothetical protein